jgi:hypothetical protein
VVENFKNEVPGFFTFSSELHFKQYNLRLSEAIEDFVKVCVENIFPNTFLESEAGVSNLDEEVIASLRNKLNKIKEDDKLTVVKDTPAKDLVENWGSKVSKEVEGVKKVVNDLKAEFHKIKSKGGKPSYRNKPSYQNKPKVFSPSKNFASKGTVEYTSKNSFSPKWDRSKPVSLNVNWFNKAEFAKADLRSATIKCGGKVLKFNPKVPILDKDATVKIGSVLFWRNGSVVKNRNSYFSRNSAKLNASDHKTKN